LGLSQVPHDFCNKRSGYSDEAILRRRGALDSRANQLGRRFSLSFVRTFLYTWIDRVQSTPHGAAREAALLFFRQA
jgi:hypothetical protein